MNAQRNIVNQNFSFQLSLYVYFTYQFNTIQKLAEEKWLLMLKWP